MLQKIMKVIQRLTHVLGDLQLNAKVLLRSGQPVDSGEAMACLQQCYPSFASSCRKSRNPDYDNRSLLLSVIVPAYNEEKYIENCLDSILSQLAPGYEVIVVNDGSTDATPSLLDKYCHHEQLRIIHQENSGLSVARNAGIACAKGEYLCFVDSDDELPENALQNLMTTALEKNAKLVIGSYEKRFRFGKTLHTNLLPDQKVSNVSLPGFAHGRVIHYSVFQNLQFPEGYWFEDSIMAQIVHPLCQDAAYTISPICYLYYQNEAGIAATAMGKMKSIDSLWITMLLLKERMHFGLDYNQASYEHFLSMVNLTYQRTKLLDPCVAQCIFAVQRMLQKEYYDSFRSVKSKKNKRIEKALRENNFRKYIFACSNK